MCPCQRDTDRGVGSLTEWKASDLLCPWCKVYRELTAEGAPTDPLAIAERAVDGWGSYVPLVLGGLGAVAALAVAVAVVRRVKEHSR